MGIESKHTVGWVDVLRIMACFLVVFAIVVIPLLRVLIPTALLSCRDVRWEVPCAAAYRCLS